MAARAGSRVSGIQLGVFAEATYTHIPVIGLHMSSVQGLLSLHTMGVDWHTPPTHMSVVQLFPSEHVLESLAT